MLERDAASGIHRIEDANTNWYLVEDGDRLTVVDCGVPTSWQSFEQALGILGRRKDDVQAIVLTHAHFDHLGFAERARRELHVPVWCHENDVPLTRHPAQYGHERPRSFYMLRPKTLPIVAAFTKARAFFPRAVEKVERYYENGTLPVPGSPHVVFTPGHTIGHCSLHFPDRDTLIAGDAVVTLQPVPRGARAAARLRCHGRLGAGAPLPGRGRGHGSQDCVVRARPCVGRRRGSDRGGCPPPRTDLAAA